MNESEALVRCYGAQVQMHRGVAFVQALGPASWDWQERAHKLVWKFKRVQGGTDITLKVGVPILRTAWCLSLDSRTAMSRMGL